MAEKLSNAPVFYTLIQVRFSPVLNMETFVPAIQDRMRRNGYIGFRQEIAHSFQLEFSSQEPSVAPVQAKRWHFIDKDGTSGAVLQTDSFIFHTTAYDRFPVFLRSCMESLAIVHAEAALSLVERIGIRYLDLVTAFPGDSLKQYLNQGLHGVVAELTGELVQSVTESMIKTQLGTLITRAVSRNGRFELPPDLVPFYLNLKPEFGEINGPHAILDNDHISEQSFDFDLKTVEERIDALHEGITEAFKASVTQHALNRWA